MSALDEFVLHLVQPVWLHLPSLLVLRNPCSGSGSASCPSWHSEAYWLCPLLTRALAHPNQSVRRFIVGNIIQLASPLREVSTVALERVMVEGLFRAMDSDEMWVATGAPDEEGVEEEEDEQEQDDKGRPKAPSRGGHANEEGQGEQGKSQKSRKGGGGGDKQKEEMKGRHERKVPRRGGYMTMEEDSARLAPSSIKTMGWFLQQWGEDSHAGAEGFLHMCLTSLREGMSMPSCMGRMLRVLEEGVNLGPCLHDACMEDVRAVVASQAVQTSPWCTQICNSVLALLTSWFNPSACSYRRLVR
eukprot:CAMPEP_0184375146 /NCGR_PEP_ID=MMETSP1089-20130417/165404_1 /TAXON_ID=38269 ORGANISM="Gloeochaete wittrockiana, Strain SAG46.84" /NCGR_SAMPLE_ID=MMETSP1089 /ASSEMBLY_ACC=CAM_ASM_000445 /LENGTH=301 /DNA_ID=CAMNT_0026718199 /DNA_START=637 /DNA_END=1538 /DNA_ORIENTATION=+